MIQFLRKVMRDNNAVTLVEYGLLVGLLGLAMVFGLTAFTNQLYVLFQVVKNATHNP
ncbi:Flp family type IVb pilin [Novosphingobium pituita]|uniref:Flp family type IVb pilin n=1 Tax=Novosphingobium pituita TaxID=3056842 RepID=A0ABQ6P484_9SPHN|nr:Flp family type IVb pilin [Novosphingobium sp. IK01]GMM60058.1 hypothetical protein NUTIK01_08350 [Novosphingobium sp. IK01]